MRRRKEKGKAGESPEEPAEKVLGKAKITKPSPKRKVLKKRKSQGKKDRVHPHSHILRKLKGRGYK